MWQSAPPTAGKRPGRKALEPRGADCQWQSALPLPAARRRRGGWENLAVCPKKEHKPLWRHRF